MTINTPTLAGKYLALRDNAVKGTPEHIGYHWIAKALESSDPKQGLLDAITKAEDRIKEHDNRKWNRRDGYRWYYHRIIELCNTAIEDLEEVE